MRPTMRPEGLLEHIALWGNLGPIPLAEAMFGMATARVMMAGCRLGIYAALSREAQTSDEVARICGLDSAGTEHILDCLCALGHVRRRGAEHVMTARARRWLDPASPTYVGGFLEFNYDQWEWWSHLEQVVKTGRGHEIHGYDADDPRWRRYITAMFQLARLSAPEIARKLRLPPSPTSVLDLAGGHGAFAAELCRRHPGITATVLDLPASARIGREIIAAYGAGDRVTFREGDLLSDDLEGPYDAVLCFQIIHHLTPNQNLDLLRRVSASLAPGGIVAVMDYFAPPANRTPDSAAFLGLHFYLTSNASTYRVDDLCGWLQKAGFAPPRRVRVLSLPIQGVYEARKSG